jgi:hypothetical protein
MTANLHDGASLHSNRILSVKKIIECLSYIYSIMPRDIYAEPAQSRQDQYMEFQYHTYIHDY